jgi:hypothetical protein
MQIVQSRGRLVARNRTRREPEKQPSDEPPLDVANGRPSARGRSDSRRFDVDEKLTTQSLAFCAAAA